MPRTAVLGWSCNVVTIISRWPHDLQGHSTSDFSEYPLLTVPHQHADSTAAAGYLPVDLGHECARGRTDRLPGQAVTRGRVGTITS